MNDITEWFKIFGINGGVIGVTSLTDLELIFKILLLGLTCVWTAVKIIKLIKEEE
tara:strand:- start:631 stop:795 length:165 start_codon:yes stop_codon:yes gene_type:complete